MKTKQSKLTFQKISNNKDELTFIRNENVMDLTDKLSMTIDQNEQRKRKANSELSVDSLPEELSFNELLVAVGNKDCLLNEGIENDVEIVVKADISEFTESLDDMPDEITFTELLQVISGKNDRLPLFELTDGNSKLKKVEKHETYETNLNSKLEELAKYTKSLNCKEIYFSFLSKVVIDKQKSWIDLYCPKSSKFFFNCFPAVVKLKEWLEKWKNVGKKSNGDHEIKSRVADMRDNSDSDFEMNGCVYDNSDSDVSDNDKDKPEAFCIIRGPCGSGKSTIIHSIATELDFRVFESDCSSVRTGRDFTEKFESLAKNFCLSLNHSASTNSAKRPIVFPTLSSSKNRRKSEFFKPNLRKRQKLSSTSIRQFSTDSDPVKVNKNSLILFDDVDIVFEQDLGFFNSVFSLIKKRKRPVVLTCSDSTEMDKIIQKIGRTKFLDLSLYNTNLSLNDDICVYMQMILLSRGIDLDFCTVSRWIDQFSIAPNDIRSCLQNLHFYSVLGAHLPSCSSTYPIFLPDWTQLKSAKQICPLLEAFSFVDSYTRVHRRNPFVSSRFGNFDRLPETSYCSLQDISQEIGEFLQLEYSRIVERGSHQIYEYSTSRFRQTEIADKRINQSVSLQNAVAGCQHQIDLTGALRQIASHESSRRRGNKQRRFLHYFDRLQYKISESDISHLSKPFGAY